MKRKRNDLERLLHVLDATKIEYAKAQIEVTDKSTGVVRHMTVIQNGFTFDRLTGKYLFTHHGALIKPEYPRPPGCPQPSTCMCKQAERNRRTPDPARQ